MGLRLMEGEPEREPSPLRWESAMAKACQRANLWPLLCQALGKYPPIKIVSASTDYSSLSDERRIRLFKWG